MFEHLGSYLTLCLHSYFGCCYLFFACPFCMEVFLSLQLSCFCTLQIQCVYTCAFPAIKKRRKKAQLRTPGKLIADREGMVMLCMFTNTGVIIQVPFTPELQCSQCAFATTTNW